MERVSSIAQDVVDIGRIAVIPTILQVASRTTGLRFAAIARVTDKSWTACAIHDSMGFGLKPGDELALETTICNEIRQHGRPVVFSHASADERFAAHPTPKLYGFESYISVPIVLADGGFFGTLCALDPLPVQLDDPNILSTLELLAQLVAARIDTEEQLAKSSKALLDAQEKAKLREQFVAILGHDLRNPLQSIIMGAEMLQETLQGARENRLLVDIKLSCARMGELIHNVLDFAQGRMGEGLAIEPELCRDLADSLRHVITEIRRAHPDHVIELDTLVEHEVFCDRQRIAQLLGNLISNGVKHGAPDKPVTVLLRSDGETFEIAVENAGAPIPQEKIGRLFRPFTRGETLQAQQGLGLGLYIASEIARAHDGSLGVTSDETATRFVFRMPVRPAEPMPASKAVA